MSDYVWCHGPSCHTQHTQDRIRGVKGSKVLRTKKIKQELTQVVGIVLITYIITFVVKVVIMTLQIQYVQQCLVAIAPRTEPLETPIEVTKEQRQYGWRDGTYTQTVINTVDNSS